MPKPTAKELQEFTADHGPIRLGCKGGCLRGDYDGVKLFPGDWSEIEEVQSLQDALTTYEDDDDGEPPPGYSVMDWETHYGYCPACRLAGADL